MPEETGTIEFDPEKASRGGLAGILEFRGRLVRHTRIPNKFGPTRTKYGSQTEENPEGTQEVAPDQIQVDFEDTVIMVMAEGEEEPELEDGKFNILINYAKPGQAKSHALSQWNRGYADSCKEVWSKLPNEMHDEVVQIGKREVAMKIRDRETKQDNEVTAVRWCFVPMDDVVTDTNDRARSKIEGKNKSAALRAIMQDQVLKKDTALRDAVSAGKPVAGMEVIDGIYVVTEES